MAALNADCAYLSEYGVNLGLSKKKKVPSLFYMLLLHMPQQWHIRVVTALHIGSQALRERMYLQRK